MAKVRGARKISDLDEAIDFNNIPVDDGTPIGKRMTKASLKALLTIEGTEMEPLVGGTTSGTALVVPNGPAGEQRTAEVSSGKWYDFGSGPVQASADRRWKSYWSGTAWSLKDMGALPEIPVANVLGGSETEAASQNLVSSINGKWFTEPGKFIRSSNGVIDNTSTEGAVVTGFIDLSVVNNIRIKGRSTATHALYAYYDQNKAFISAVSGPEFNNALVEINKSEFPVNAKYFVGSASALRESDSLEIFSIKDLYNKIEQTSTMIDGKISNKIDKPVGQPSGKLLVTSGIDVDYKTPEQVKLASVGNWFNIPGKFIRATDGSIGDTTVENAVITDFIDISDIELIEINGRATATHALYAFYGAGKVFISALAGVVNRDVTILIPRENFPTGAQWFVGSASSVSLVNFLKIDTLKSLRVELSQLSRQVNGLSADNIGDITGIGFMGASLMYPGNDWPRFACEILNVVNYNKAESGIGHPVYFANRLWRNVFCTDEEFENMDVLAIQFANNSNLELTDGLKATPEDYTIGFDQANTNNPFEAYTNYQNLDYILKFWQNKCYAQKDNPSSKWYGTDHGKPFRVLFVTNWHDSRPYYNNAIREVANRWGCSVCPMDEKIGFSKNQPLNGSQVSIMYAQDTQVLDGVTYGWHPRRGEPGKYIQKKMANIFSRSIIHDFSMR